MKTRNNLLLIVLASIYFSFCCGMVDKDEKYGNIEIYNGAGEPLVISFIDPSSLIDKHTVIIDNKRVDYDTVAESHLPGLIWGSYKLEIKNEAGNVAELLIENVTNKNNIFIDIYKSGNHGFNVIPFKRGLLSINAKSRNGKNLIKNIKDKDITFIRR